MTLDPQSRAFSLLGLSIVITGIIVSWAAYAIRSAERSVITTTGSAKERVMSDTAKWTGEISRRVPSASIASGYAMMDRDQVALRAYLKSKGVDLTALDVRPINAQEEVYYGSDGPRATGMTILRQTFVFSAADVEGVTKIATDLRTLIADGTPVSTLQLEYLYSKLPDLRVRLLGGAVKDAKARASEIAESGGRSVGELSYASSGVVQVLAPNSIEISDYGSYDTSSIEKEVMVTVRATFQVR